jgi:hypothetical protein
MAVDVGESQKHPAREPRSGSRRWPCAGVLRMLSIIRVSAIRSGGPLATVPISASTAAMRAIVAMLTNKRIGLLVRLASGNHAKNDRGSVCARTAIVSSTLHGPFGPGSHWHHDVSSGRAPVCLTL